MFGGPSGGFLNLGTPEMVVIGAVAWALIGPKELYKLARQAGEFLGEWQQLGMQARDTFKDAIEEELREEEKTKPTASSFSTETPSPLQDLAADTPFAPQPATAGLDGASTLSETELDALQAQVADTLGDPAANAAAFQEQISGARNEAVLREYPAELSADDDAGSAVFTGEDWGAPGMALQDADEALLQTEIEEAENR